MRIATLGWSIPGGSTHYIATLGWLIASTPALGPTRFTVASDAADFAAADDSARFTGASDVVDFSVS